MLNNKNDGLRNAVIVSADFGWIQYILLPQMFVHKIFRFLRSVSIEIGFLKSFCFKAKIKWI